MNRGKIDLWTKNLKPLLESVGIDSLLLAYCLLSKREQFTTWVRANIYPSNGNPSIINLPIKNYKSVSASFSKRGIRIDLGHSVGAFKELKKYYEDNIME